VADDPHAVAAAPVSASPPPARPAGGIPVALALLGLAALLLLTSGLSTVAAGVPGFTLIAKRRFELAAMAFLLVAMVPFAGGLGG